MGDGLQGTLFPIESNWIPPKLSELPSWANAERVGLDIETCDPYLKQLGPSVRRGGYIVGVSFAIEGGPSAYLPFDHLGGDNLPKEQVLRYLRDQAKCFKGSIVGANLPYDLDYLQHAGIRFRPHRFLDVQVADPIINELHDSYSLDAISQRWGFKGKDKQLLEEAARSYGYGDKVGANIWRLPARYVGPYATEDAELPLRLLRMQEKQIAAQGLEAVYDMECRLLPALLAMRVRGIRIDTGRLQQVSDWALAQERLALHAVNKLAGTALSPEDVWCAEPLAEALGRVGAAAPLTAKGKPSITAAWLEQVDHPVAKALRRARKMNKVRTTFVQSLIDHMVNGRVHCTLNQLRNRREEEDGADKGARFGRLSSSDPNFQQQPVRDPEIGALWRKVFLPEPGEQWACLDYSQQEPRWFTHFAAQIDAPLARKVRDAYINDPKTDNHDMMATLINPNWPCLADKKIKKQERDVAKTIFLGLCYGMGEAKLCRQCGYETVLEYCERRKKQVEKAGPEGRALLQAFHARVPYVRALSKAVSDKAAAAGFIRTVLGRRCRFPLSDRGGFDWTEKAVNRLVQGSSADQTKMALVLAHEAAFPLQLQVHDELDLSVPNREMAVDLSKIMLEAVPCSVPHKVDLEMGPSWGELS